MRSGGLNDATCCPEGPILNINARGSAALLIRSGLQDCLHLPSCEAQEFSVLVAFLKPNTRLTVIFRRVQVCKITAKSLISIILLSLGIIVAVIYYSLRTVLLRLVLPEQLCLR